MQAAADLYVQVITTAAEPFAIVFASRAWLQVCEYSTQQQVIGKTLDFLSGPLTTRESLETLVASFRAGLPATTPMVSYTSSGRPFRHSMRIEPLRDSQGKLHCFQITSVNVRMLNGTGSSPPKSSEAGSQDGRGASGAERVNIKLDDMLDLFDASTPQAELKRRKALKNRLEADESFDTAWNTASSRRCN